MIESIPERDGYKIVQRYIKVKKEKTKREDVLAL